MFLTKDSQDDQMLTAGQVVTECPVLYRICNTFLTFGKDSRCQSLQSSLYIRSELVMNQGQG